MLRDKVRRAAAAGIALTVLRNTALAVSRVLAQLAPCRRSQATVRVQEQYVSMATTLLSMQSIVVTRIGCIVLAANTFDGISRY